MTLRAPYLDDGDVRLYVGDCVEVMREMDAESVDAVVCDPPYGLEFMGKDWDAPWKDTRTDKRGVIDPAAWGGQQDGNGGNPYSRARIRTAAAHYGGNPASVNAAFAAWCETWAREALRVLKPGGHLLAFGGTRTFHRLTCGIEDAGFEIRDCLSWLYASGFPKSLDVSKAIDKAAGAEREVVGVRSYPTQPNGRSGLHQGYAPDQMSGAEVNNLVTAPATDAAREWQGWGTALKPAWEPCVVARKPLVGTVAANVQQHGTGALNIDGCRIGTESTRRDTGTAAMWANAGRVIGGSDAGRWPANVAFDEQAAAMLDAQSGVSSSRSALMPLPRNCGFAGSVYGGDGSTNGASVRGHDDTGGASRFFYTAKASRADRNAGGLADNTHPTVKPTDLMRWLVRLVTPPGGIVLDPFSGSGSTLVAARAEGVRAVGIEREDEYARIIADRLAQLSLFTEGME
jgi:site-specific DNA-methyltransferase (adenine-specific)